MQSRRLLGPRTPPAHMLARASLDPEITVVGYVDGTVALIDTDGGLRVIEVGDDIADVAVTLAGDEPILAVALPGSVAILPLGQPSARIADLPGHDGRVTKVALFAHADDMCAVSADERGNVHRWHLPGGKRVSVHRVHRKSVHTLVPGRLKVGRMAFLTASDDREAIVHDLHDEGVRHILTPHAGWIERATPADSDGDLDVVVTTDRIGITLWDVANTVAVARIPIDRPRELACWSGPSGVNIAVGTELGHIVLYTPSGTGRMDPPEPGSVSAIALTGRACTSPTLRLALGNGLFELTADGRWIKSVPPFPSSILNMLAWTRHSGAVVVLVDGSIWLVTW